MKCALAFALPVGRRKGGGAAPLAPVVRNVVSPVGDSWTEGNQQRLSRDNTLRQDDVWDYQLAALLGVTKYLTPGQTSVSAGVINVGYGGQNTNTIKNNLFAILSSDPARLQDAFILGPGRNDTPNAGGDTAILAGVDAMTAAIPHNRVVIWPPDGAIGGVMNAASSIGSWVRAKKAHWAYRDDSRRRYLFELGRYYRGVSPNGSNGTSQDDQDTAGDKLIGSLAASAGGSNDHPNYLAAPLWAAAFRPLVEALWNKGVYVLDTTLAVPFDMAAGTTKEIHFKGYVTSCSISSDDATVPGCFTIAMKSGSNDTAVITRTSVSAANITRVLNLQITANGVDTAGAAKTHTGLLRIVPTLGGSASTVPKGATFQRDTNATATSRRWPFVSFENSPWANGTKYSFVARMKAGEDSTTMTLWSQASTRVLIQRGTGNKFSIRFQDSAGADVMNWTTVTTNFNIAAGAFWLFIDIDMNGGSPVANVWANVGGADVNIAPATALAPGNGTLSLASQPYMFNTGNAQCNMKGSVGPVWAADDVFASGGFSSSTNRRLFCDINGNPVDLGAAGVTGGITPEVYIPGGPGDWMIGKNAGSGPQFGFNDNWLRGFGANSSDPLPF